MAIYWVKSNNVKCNAYNIIKNRFININGFTQLKKLGQIQVYFYMSTNTY